MKLDEAFMAQLIQSITAAYGGKVTLRKRYGKTEVITRADMKKRVLSEKQIEVNDVMGTASHYAKNIIADKMRKKEAQVRLNVSSNRLYHALVREYFLVNSKKIEDPYKITAVIQPIESLNAPEANREVL
jgi:hypothetical protein